MLQLTPPLMLQLTSSLTTPGYILLVELQDLCLVCAASYVVNLLLVWATWPSRTVAMRKKQD